MRIKAPFTLTAAALGACALLSTLSSTAFANTPSAGADASQGNVINFSVNSSTEVTNDEATARFSKEAQAKDAAVLATALNPTVNQALAIAKKYPSIFASTGNQSSYPRYDNKGKMNGVQGSAGIVLKSQNIDELSRAIAEIQVLMTLDDLSFNVSNAQIERTNQRLMGETVTKFRAQADTISSAWGAKSYRLVQADMNSQSYQREPVYARMEMVATASDASAPQQQLQAGESTVRYTINGTIQLVY